MTVNKTDIWSTAQDLAGQAQDLDLLDPREPRYGFFSYSDRHPAFGGGQGGFLWFASQSALLDFLANHFVIFNFPPAEEQEAISLQTEAKKAVEQIGANEIDALVSPLNSALKGIVQITWMGRFIELVEGDKDFARQLRLGFRDEASANSIHPDELEEFVEYLQTYGI